MYSFIPIVLIIIKLTWSTVESTALTEVSADECETRGTNKGCKLPQSMRNKLVDKNKGTCQPHRENWKYACDGSRVILDYVCKYYAAHNSPALITDEIDRIRYFCPLCGSVRGGIVSAYGHPRRFKITQQIPNSPALNNEVVTYCDETDGPQWKYWGTGIPIGDIRDLTEPMISSLACKQAVITSVQSVQLEVFMNDKTEYELQCPHKYRPLVYCIGSPKEWSLDPNKQQPAVCPESGECYLVVGITIASLPNTRRVDNNQEVVVQCDGNRWFVSNSQHNKHTTTCRNGAFKPPIPHCIELCPQIKNANQLEESKRYPGGRKVVNAKCSSGYTGKVDDTYVQDVKIECMRSSSSWDKKLICTENAGIVCQSPVTWQNLHNGGFADNWSPSLATGNRFECKDGFYLTGRSAMDNKVDVECKIYFADDTPYTYYIRKGGGWVVLQCDSIKGNFCASSDLDNAYTTDKDWIPNQTSIVGTCRMGYALKSNDKIPTATCTEGTWTFLYGKCKKLCPKIDNSIEISESQRFPSTEVNAKCARKYFGVTGKKYDVYVMSLKITCRESDGNWNKNFKCITNHGIYCPFDATGRNGAFEDDKLPTVAASNEFKCRAGFYISNQASPTTNSITVKCKISFGYVTHNLHLNPSDDQLRCDQINDHFCRYSKLPPHYKTNMQVTELTKQDDGINLACADGYGYRDGETNKEFTCSANGVWKYQGDDCEKLCPAITNSNMSMPCRFSGIKTTVGCLTDYIGKTDNGYQLHSEQECNAKFKWDKNFSCEKSSSAICRDAVANANGGFVKSPSLFQAATFTCNENFFVLAKTNPANNKIVINCKINDNFKLYMDPDPNKACAAIADHICYLKNMDLLKSENYEEPKNAAPFFNTGESVYVECCADCITVGTVMPNCDHGKWVINDGACHATCENIGMIPNSINDRAPGSSHNVACRDNQVLHYTKHQVNFYTYALLNIFCNATSKWEWPSDFESIKCIDKHVVNCTLDPEARRGSFNKSTLTLGQSIKFTCQENFQLVSGSTVIEAECKLDNFQPKLMPANSDAGNIQCLETPETAARTTSSAFGRTFGTDSATPTIRNGNSSTETDDDFWAAFEGWPIIYGYCSCVVCILAAVGVKVYIDCSNAKYAERMKRMEKTGFRVKAARAARKAKKAKGKK